MRQEKRETPRISIQDKVTMRVAGELGYSSCTLDDISQGGVRFSVGRELAVGSRIELRISSLEGEPDIALQACILRVTRHEGGVFDYACRLEGVENA